MLVYGLDIGTTSIGFAAVELHEEQAQGKILRLGVRIFPEARDPDGTPLNQQRRAKRMMRRQLRRRRQRRKALNETLSEAGLLPAYSSAGWPKAMTEDPYALRARGLEEPLSPHELGRALYHLAKRRHFRARGLEEAADKDSGADEKEAKNNRDATLAALRKSGATTFGKWLAEKPTDARKRGFHATRDVVGEEFEALWEAQAPHHPVLGEDGFKDRITDIVFAQRPVFWRKNTLGECPLIPGAELCPKGSWLSQQRRMLEKLNNLSIAGGNLRKLDEEERKAILARLQTQGSMGWPGVRKALEPLFKVRGESAKHIKFNLEVGGEPGLLGNALEAKFAAVLGAEWEGHPHKDTIRHDVPKWIWEADYGEVGTQRVVIRSDRERKVRRGEVETRLQKELGLSQAESKEIAAIHLKQGWEPYSTEALQKILPELEKGTRFGSLINSTEAKWADWRNAHFPRRDQPTGEILDLLPSPNDREESRRLSRLRNPTVVRAQNELRKVVNNLIRLYGKPDRIRVELARNLGKSKREREEILSSNRKQEKRRKEARAGLILMGIPEPSRRDIEKWLLWKESRERCPYTGDLISFDDLFRNGRYQVEHIWPRSRSLDDGFRNKTLCRVDVNIAKGNRTPFEHFQHRPDDWKNIKDHLNRMTDSRDGMSPGKVKRFLAEAIPDDFVQRQLNDTGYTARQTVAFLKKLWPDLGAEAPVNVLCVSGRVTAQLRKRWGLNNILSDDGEKTRADHRHHAVDALAVACTNAAFVQRLSRYFQDEERHQEPCLPPPWPTIRQDAARAIEAIIVSHRVRKKISGPLHKETTYGDTGTDETTKSGTYRVFVTRKKIDALTKGELEDIRDERVREIVKKWVADHGGDPKKAFATYPKLGEGGPEIRKVRLCTKQQLRLMAPVSTGYADKGDNHHIAIYRTKDGKAEFEVVSRFDAAQRLVRREPIVRRDRGDDTEFVMSLSPGDALSFPEGLRKGTWIVQGVWASGQVVIQKHNDALGCTVTRPTAGSLLKDCARKVKLDPLGRSTGARD